MPVHKTKGGYKYGETGKTYKDKKSAIKQAIAIAYSKAKNKGRKPTQEEIRTEITGTPAEIDKVASGMINYSAYGLKKQADYSTYGLKKLAEAQYGSSLRVARDDPNSYINQIDKAYRDNIGKIDPTLEYKIGWNPFLRSPHLRWKPLTWFTGTKPGEEATWNIFENVGATWWNPKRLFFDSELTREQGDHIRNGRIIQAAMREAGDNPELFKTVYRDLKRRSDLNIKSWEKTGKIRPGFYTDPMEIERAKAMLEGKQYRDNTPRVGDIGRVVPGVPPASPDIDMYDPNAGSFYDNSRRGRHESRRAIAEGRRRRDKLTRALASPERYSYYDHPGTYSPFGPGERYWGDQPASHKNWYYTPTDDALAYYKSLDPEPRFILNRRSVGL